MRERDRVRMLREPREGSAQGSGVFGTMAELARKAINAFTVTISILDGDISFSMAEAGLPPAGGADIFAALCIRSASAVLIVDAENDPSFGDNFRFSLRSPVRSCVGTPLRDKTGTVVGAICAFSPDAGAFDNCSKASLNEFATLIEQALGALEVAAQLRRANNDLVELNQMFRLAEAAAGIGAWSLSLGSGDLRWSPQVFAIHGLGLDMEINPALAISFYDPLDRPMVRDALAEAQATGKPFKFEAGLRRADGVPRRVRVQGEPIVVAGCVQSISGVIVDCSEEHRVSLALDHAVCHDQLTGLLNRSGFTRVLEDVCSSNSAPLLTVLLIDLDGFRAINDTYGHQVADRLIVEVGQLLAARLSADVIIARWGEDEFVLLLTADTALEEARRFACQLLGALKGEMQIGAEVIHVSATCGIGQVRDPCAPQDVVRRAGVALDLGKQIGPGEIHCWSPELDLASCARQRAVFKLAHALSSDEAFAAYQPIVSLEDRSVVAFEALLRLDADPQASLSTSDILPALSDPSMSREVFRFMLGKLAREVPRLIERYGPDCHVAINVSEADFRLSQGEDNFLNVLTHTFRSQGVRSTNITIEVTESMLLRDEDGYIRDTLRTLHRLGYSIALDDFGTGYSSLTHLRDFPIRKVKIDKSFVAAITSDHQSRMIVQAIVQMARSLGITAIAEGVENASEELFLRAIGCDQAQGYRFGKAKRLSLMNGINAVCEGADRRTGSATRVEVVGRLPNSGGS